METETQKHSNISVAKKTHFSHLTKFSFCCLVSIGTVKKTSKKVKISMCKNQKDESFLNPRVLMLQQMANISPNKVLSKKMSEKRREEKRREISFFSVPCYPPTFILSHHWYAPLQAASLGASILLRRGLLWQCGYFFCRHWP